MDNHYNTNDEAMFDHIDSLQGSPAPRADIVFTPAGMKRLSALDKSGLRMLQLLTYFNAIRYKHDQPEEVLVFIASDSSDLCDYDGNVISTYQLRRRGIRNLQQNGFIRAVNGRKDAWTTNPDYIGIRRPVGSMRKSGGFYADAPYNGSQTAGSLFATR